MHFIFVFISYLKRLQDEAIGLRNRKKILDIIEQSPEVHNTYKFKDIFDAPKPHTTYRLFQWILDKVRIIGLAAHDLILVRKFNTGICYCTKFVQITINLLNIVMNV